MITELVELPWVTLLTLASGYAAYYVANTGLRAHHKPIDVAFSTLVFGFCAAYLYEWLIDAGWESFTASPSAFVASIIVGGLWRRLGRGSLRKALRLSKVSHSDDLPNAWTAIFDVTGVETTQLSVLLKDGTWLQCDDLSRFKDAPNGPCVLGGEGDVLIYVTDSRKPDEDSIENDAVAFEDWGEEITYIPATQIARVDIRRKR